MGFQSGAKHQRSAVRAALEDLMKVNCARLAEDQDFPERELFENSDQDNEGWEKVIDIQVEWETARIWEHSEDNRLIVVLSDGGNEDDYEVWEVA